MAAMEVRLSDAVARLAASLTDIAGVPVELERPGDAEHGDYATNVALKLAGLQKRPPREIADEIAAKTVADGLAERAESAGPGFVNLWLADSWLASGLREIVEAGAAFGCRLCLQTRAHSGGDGLCEPDRADHGRSCT